MTLLHCDKPVQGFWCVHLVFNKETRGSVRPNAADRPTDVQIDNTQRHNQASSLGKLHHSLPNNDFHSVPFLAIVSFWIKYRKL